MTIHSDSNSPAAALRAAAYEGNSAVVRRLIDEAVDLNVWDQRGRTALSLAAGRGHLEIVRLLLASGAWIDPHEDYDCYETPLIAAAENGHLPVVKALVAAGANPEIHGGISQATAEFFARQNGHLEVSEYLRKRRDKRS